MEQKTTLGLYGPRVIGQEQFDEEQRAVLEQSTKYGPRVLGQAHPANRAFAEAMDAVQEANAALSSAKSPGARKKATERVVAARKDLALARRELEAAGGKASPKVGSGVRMARPQVVPSIPENRELVGSAESPPPPPPPPPPSADFGEFTLKALGAWLGDNPEKLEEALDAELARETPRVGALKAILERELKRDGGARDEIVGRIANA